MLAVTGNELVAWAIHNRSPRKSGPFVPAHSATLPRLYQPRVTKLGKLAQERGEQIGAQEVQDAVELEAAGEVIKGATDPPSGEVGSLGGVIEVTECQVN